MNNNDLEERMNRVLAKLGLPFTVQWVQDPTNKSRGNIDVAQGTIHIFNVDEQGAWDTFLHEVLELKLKRITKLYRGLVNMLIEYIEKHVYQEKEAFLESLPFIVKEIEEMKQDE